MNMKMAVRQETDWLRTIVQVRLVKDGMSEDDATAAIAGALEFIAESEPGDSPGPLTDLAWHQMILCTREYAALCDELRGHFVHHQPFPADSCDQGGGDCTAPPRDEADCGNCRTPPCDRG